VRVNFNDFIPFISFTDKGTKRENHLVANTSTTIDNEQQKKLALT